MNATNIAGREFKPSRRGGFLSLRALLLLTVVVVLGVGWARTWIMRADRLIKAGCDNLAILDD